MPELPEVETIRRRLSEVLPGQTITQIDIVHPKSFQGNQQTLIGKTVSSVERRAKILHIPFGDNLNLLIHLKMTGQLLYQGQVGRIGGGHPTADWIADLPTKHTRVIITFADDSKLFFNDQRIFGWLKQVDDRAVQAEFQKYGPDIIDTVVNKDYLYQRLQKRRSSIKLVMLDASVVAGLGNIYVCDALFAAGIDPRRPANSLNFQETERLLLAAKGVVQKGIAAGGTTFDGSYVSIDGLAGNYQEQVLVYGRAGESCSVCGAVIEKIMLGNRGTYFCPLCQQ